MAQINWNWVSPTEAATAVKTVNDTANTNYDEQQKRDLNAIFARNIDDKGNPRPGFYHEAAAAGLNPSAIQTAQKYFQGQQELNQSTAMGNTLERSLGYNPLAGQTPRQPAPTQTAPKQPTTAPADQNSNGTPPQSWFGDVADKVKGWFGATPDTTRENYAYLTPNERYESAQPIVDNSGLIQSQPSMVTDKSGFTTPDMLAANSLSAAGSNSADLSVRNGSVDLGSGAVSASSMDPSALQSLAPSTDTAPVAPNAAEIASATPPAPAAPAAPATPWYEDFQRSYDPAKSMLGATGAGTTGAGITPADKQLLQWQTKDDGSNVYRQYDNALGQYLTSIGFAPIKNETTSDVATRYLSSVYTNVLLQNAPAGINPLALLKDPKNPGAGLSELGEQMIKATQQGKIAEGKARDAVLQAKAALGGIADKYGVQNVQEKELQVGDGTMLYDKSKRENVGILKIVQSDAPQLEKQINASPDIVSLQMLMPQVAKLSGQSMGGVQPTEFNIQETYKGAFPELDQTTVARIAAATVEGFRTGNFDKANAAINSLGKAFDAKTLQSRMLKMVEMAKSNADIGLKTYTYGGQAKTDIQNSNSSGPLSAPNPPPPAALPKGSWFSDPSNKVFQGVSGDPYYVTQRDSGGNAVKAQNFRGSQFDVVDRGNGVVLNPVPELSTPAPVRVPSRRAPATGHKNGDTWSDASYQYRMINGKIQRKAR